MRCKIERVHDATQIGSGTTNTKTSAGIADVAQSIAVWLVPVYAPHGIGCHSDAVVRTLRMALNGLWPVPYADVIPTDVMPTNVAPDTTMARDEDYQRLIREYAGHDRLLELWDAIQTGDTPGWDAGRAFEYLVLRGFELEGATVKWPYDVRLGRDSDGATIEQIDGVVYCEGLSCLCEMKDHEGHVNAEPIAKMRNQLLRRPAGTIGAVFARKMFTEPAVVLARFLGPQSVLLWTGLEIAHALRHRLLVAGLVAKYRHAVEYGLPDLKITDEELQGREQS